MIIDNTKIFALKCLINDINKKIENETIDFIHLVNLKGIDNSETKKQEKIINLLETTNNIIKYILNYKPIFTQKKEI